MFKSLASTRNGMKTWLAFLSGFLISVAILIPSVQLNRYVFPDNTVFNAFEHMTGGLTKEVSLLDTFVRYDGSGAKYRPIANSGYLAKFYANRLYWEYSGVAVNVVAITLAFIALFLVCRTLQIRHSISFLVATAHSFTPVFINQSWLHAVTEDALVVALSAFIILCYNRFKERGNGIAGAVCLILCFVTPYYKEPCIAATLAVFIAELISVKRNIRWLGALGVISLNALYPSVLSNLLFFGDLIKPAFTSDFAHSIPYTPVAKHLWAQVPLTVSISVFSIFLISSRKIQAPLTSVLTNKLDPFFLKLRSLSYGVAVIIAFTPFLLFYAIPEIDVPVLLIDRIQGSNSLFKSDMTSQILWCGTIVFASYMFICFDSNLRVVAIWFVGTFVGMSKYYFIDHHLMYTLPPFLILLGSAGEHIAKFNEEASKRNFFVLKVVVVVLLLGEGFSNVTGSYMHWKTFAKATDWVSEQVRALRPNKLWSNSILAEDVAYVISDSCKVRTEAYITRVEGKFPCDEAAKSPPQRFYSAFFNEHFSPIGQVQAKNIQQINQLGLNSRSDLVYLFNEGGQWPFWPIRIDLGVVGKSRLNKVASFDRDLKFFYIDPIRRLLPEKYLPRLVAPDWFREVLPSHASMFNLSTKFRFSVWTEPHGQPHRR